MNEQSYTEWREAEARYYGGSLNHRHDFPEWEAHPDGDSRVFRTCMTCAAYEESRIVRSDLADTPEERRRIRGATRFRRGHTLTTRGQRNIDKQRRRNSGD